MDDVVEFPEANLLRLVCGRSRVQVRPSGTEPKVKVYGEGVEEDPTPLIDAVAELLLIVSLRRHPPLRFGWLLLASLGNTSGVAAVRQPSWTHRVRRGAMAAVDGIVLGPAGRRAGVRG